MSKQHPVAASAITDTATEQAPVIDQPVPYTPTLFFGGVEEFVRCWLRFAWQHRVDAHACFWAPDWWRFDEAAARLTVLWNGWESCRMESGTALSAWWINHLDPHMAQLTSEHGPFREYYDVLTEHPHDPLPIAPLPQGHVLAHLEPHLAHLDGGCPGPYGLVYETPFTFITH